MLMLFSQPLTMQLQLVCWAINSSSSSGLRAVRCLHTGGHHCLGTLPLLLLLQEEVGHMVLRWCQQQHQPGLTSAAQAGLS